MAVKDDNTSLAERFRPAEVDEEPKHTARYGSVEDEPDTEPEGQEAAGEERDGYDWLHPEAQDASQYRTDVRADEDADADESPTQQNWLLRRRQERQRAEQKKSSEQAAASGRHGKKSASAFRMAAYAAASRQEDDARTRELRQAYHYGAKLPVRAIGRTKRYAQRLYSGAAAAARAAAAGEKAAVRHIVKAAVPALFGIAVLLTLLVAILLTTMTLKSDMEDMAETYLYITELDAAVTKEVRSAMPESGGTFYVNDYPVDEVLLQTNVDYLLLYLTVKYEDFTLETRTEDAPFGGQTVREEIARIHRQLYSRRVVYTTDDEGNSILDGVYVTVRGASELLQAQLTEDEAELLSTISAVGVYSAYQCLEMPFEGYAYVKERWGAYVTDRNRISRRDAVALVPARASTVKACADGLVVKAQNGTVWVEDEEKNRVQYEGLSLVLVSENQMVKAGDDIGSVNSELYLSYYSRGVKNVNPVFLLPSAADMAGSGDGDDIVTAALSQVGQVGGQPFWSWYGFGSRQEWCACFLSWCADQAGCLNTAVPRCSLVNDMETWYKNRGIWQSGGIGYVPRAGDIIFFDWEPDGSPDHVGLVQSCDGDMICTIEGNSGDYPGAVRVRYYSIYSSVIYGFGMPNYG